MRVRRAFWSCDNLIVGLLERLAGQGRKQAGLGHQGLLQIARRQLCELRVRLAQEGRPGDGVLLELPLLGGGVLAVEVALQPA